MNLVEYPDRDMLFLRLADTLAGHLSQFLRQQESVSFSVPGGTTPGPVFEVLSEIDLDWERVVVIPNDERWVPPDHPRANALLLRQSLLRGRAAAARLVPLYHPAPAPEKVLDTITAGVAPHLPLSLLLLGMGEDMHTASLFPGAVGLDDALSPKAPPVLALRASAAGEARVSLTAPVLTGAMETHVLILGAEKRAAIERAARRTPQEAPVRIVLDDAVIHWAE